MTARWRAFASWTGLRSVCSTIPKRAPAPMRASTSSESSQSRCGVPAASRPGGCNVSAEGAERSERAEHTEWVERADLLSARIESYRDEMVAFQRSLTAIRALGPENGGEGEWERSRFLLDQARRFGFTDIVEVDAEDERADSGE